MSEILSRAGLLEHLSGLQGVAEKYLADPEAYLKTFTVQFNGKKRHIITYKSDEKGAALRHVHTLIETLIPLCYKSMPNSFAYKKGAGILPCLEQHLASDTFLKTDIHEYFNSIKYDKLLELLNEDPTCKRNKTLLNSMISTCFFDGHLPIGFVTSPVLSDLYLHKLDDSFLERKDIVYTRYADDFVISTKNNLAALEEVESELRNNLQDYGLSLNKKKTYYRTLRKPGDAIHVLGLNLVNNAPENNRITVSDRYIRKTSKEICDYLNTGQNLSPEEKRFTLLSIIGKIEFIRHSSASSYKKLVKMVGIKYGEEVWLDRSCLKERVK